RPRSRIAARCAPRATKTTSWPAWTRRAPKYPPAPPTPTTAMLTASSESEGEAAQAAVHLLEFGHVERHHLQTQRLHRPPRLRKAAGEEDASVDGDRVGHVRFVIGNHDRLVLRESGMGGEHGGGEESPSSEPRHPALEMQESGEGLQVDETYEVAFALQDRRELSSPLPVGARREADEVRVARRADVAAVDVPRRFDRRGDRGTRLDGGPERRDLSFAALGAGAHED